jgi:hypothetical protein
MLAATSAAKISHIENCDDEHGDDVVHDGQGGKEDLQSHGHAAAQ